MATDHSFLADRRDIEFVLFEHLKIQTLFENPFFADHSIESLNEMLTAALSFCDQYLAPLNKVGDRIGCTHNKETKEVTTPPGTKEAYRQFTGNGFLTISDPIEMGGLQAPSPLGAAFLELFTAANQAFTIYPGLTKPVAHLIWSVGEEWMKKICLPKIACGAWTGTMCLTESSVGSAVGDLTTSARKMPDGSYRLKGTKQWISGGEHDITENILHCVLARVEGAPAGIEGISLFLVPKVKFDKVTGNLGYKNDMYCISIEEKLGIHGNSSCLLSFGDNGECEAFLVGKENQGISFMFLIMNEARIGVGLQGLGLASTAYLNAENYAKERIQGVDVTVKRVSENPPRVPIVTHPDVRRMLLRQRSMVEGMRALCYTAAFLYDESEHSTDVESKKKSQGSLELITPIVKAWCTDMGFQSIVQSMQTFGGYGYTKDYPVEQYLRDAKITSIYEGTNGIQALDLVGRKMRMEEGAFFLGWLERFTNFIEENRAHTELAGEFALLEEYIGGLVEAAMHMSALGKSGDRKGAVVNAYPYLLALGHTTVCGLLLEQAFVASEKLSKNVSESDIRFYRNKIKTAKFFTHHVLPEAKYYLSNVTSADRSCLDFEF